MADSRTLEEFLHNHNNGMKNLEIEKGRLAEAQKELDLDPLDSDLKKALNMIIEDLSQMTQAGPEAVFKRSLAAMENIDAKRFLIDNLLESLKRGDDQTFEATLKRYQKLGLIQTTSEPKPVSSDSMPLGEAVVCRKGITRRVLTALMQIGVNAIKSIPKWIEIEPRITIFPVPSLGFTLKGSSMNIYDLFESLKGKSR